MAVIVLWEHANYGGQAALYRNSVPEFHARWEQRSFSSLVVVSGTWSLWEGKDYSGNSLPVHANDEILDLGQFNFNDRTMSLRLDAE